MEGNEREQSHQDSWKSQEEGPIEITTDEVRARVRSYDRENVLVYWVILGRKTVVRRSVHL
jgi:type IV secretory pathway VirD2 relaxase